jgi:hypothetical protein
LATQKLENSFKKAMTMDVSLVSLPFMFIALPIRIHLEGFLNFQHNK